MDGLIGRALGKYQIVEQLGEGGMATVYKAYDSALERYVAIKIIRSGNQVDPLFLQRFQREARALAKLDHPYILKVLDYGEEEGVPYLVMPYVAHGTLKQYTQTSIPYERALGIVLPIAEALSYAHKRKIIHRDIKPANVLFGESGEPILSDFGIAKILDAGEQTQLTNTGFGIGTPAYMAPEQWNGVADERTDIYSLGIVLYELITSRCPYQADTPAAILIKQSQDALPRPKTFVVDLPENVEALIFKALAKDPAYRFQTMDEFIRGIKDVLQGKTAIYAVPPVVTQDQGATQLSYSPTRIEPAATIMQNRPAPPILQKAPAPKRKWLPFVIGGGALIVVVGIAIALISGLSKLNSQSKNTSGTPGTVSQQQNNFNNTQTALGGNVTQASPTSASKTQKTATAPQSLSVINQMPADIPVYTPNNADVITTQADQALMFYYSTTDVPKIVEDFFLTGMKNNNWQQISLTRMDAQGAVMYTFQKDTRTVMVNVMSDSVDRTSIQIIISTQ